MGNADSLILVVSPVMKFGLVALKWLLGGGRWDASTPFPGLKQMVIDGAILSIVAGLQIDTEAGGVNDSGY